MSIVKLRAALSMALYFKRNIRVARRINVIECQNGSGFVIRGYRVSDMESVYALYNQLNDGAVFSFAQRALYRYIGSRCLFVVEQTDSVGIGSIVGMNMYYVNKQDVLENTIHEGFIGVVPELNGRGIATAMRQAAALHFESAGFYGITTRISLNNKASLVSAKKIGFEPHEEYTDMVTGDRRYYMIRKF